jgi:hypothetical protein
MPSFLVQSYSKSSAIDSCGEAVLDGAGRSRSLGPLATLTSTVVGWWGAPRRPYRLSKPPCRRSANVECLSRVLGCRADGRSFSPLERRDGLIGGRNGRLDRPYTSGFGGSHHGVVRCEGLAKFWRRSDDGRNIGLGVSMFYLCVLARALVTFLQPYRQIALRACVQVEPRQPSYQYGPPIGPLSMARIDALDSGPNATVTRAFDRACDTAKTADASLAYGGSGRGSGLRWQTQESFTVARLPRCGIPKFKD